MTKELVPRDPTDHRVLTDDGQMSLEVKRAQSSI